MTGINALLFFLNETFIGIRRSRLMSLIAVATVAVTLIILGLFMVISANIGRITYDIASKLDIRLFLKKNMSIEDIQQFKRKLKSIEGINDVVFIDNDTAWNTLKEHYSHLQFDEFIEKNPLPHSLIITLNRSHDIAPMILYLKRYNTIIDDIVYGGELAERVDVFRKFISLFGWSLIILLVMSSLFIIVNTIRLTVIVRDEEIGIMQLVGATNRFIKIPFLIEGFIIGILGAGIAVTVLILVYNPIVSQLVEELPFLPFITNHSSLYYIYGFVLMSGAIIGTVGAYISISRSLK
jgi:cell division transport system permease protein